jgi:hypothetical protein
VGHPESSQGLSALDIAEIVQVADIEVLVVDIAVVDLVVDFELVVELAQFVDIVESA